MEEQYHIINSTSDENLIHTIWHYVSLFMYWFFKCFWYQQVLVVSLNSAGVSLVGWGLGTRLVCHMHESGCSCFDHVTKLLTKLREVFRNNLRIKDLEWWEISFYSVDTVHLCCVWLGSQAIPARITLIPSQRRIAFISVRDTILKAIRARVGWV